MMLCYNTRIAFHYMDQGDLNLTFVKRRKPENQKSLLKAIKELILIFPHIVEKNKTVYLVAFYKQFYTQIYTVYRKGFKFLFHLQLYANVLNWLK